MWEVAAQPHGAPSERPIVAYLFNSTEARLYSAWVSHEPDGFHYNSWAGTKHGPFESLQVAIAACELDGAHHGNKDD